MRRGSSGQNLPCLFCDKRRFKGPQKFQNNLIDLQRVVEKSLIFPLYFYSIKDIAKSKFLNFKWRHEKGGGGQSVFWYEQWHETGDREILNDIINHKEDDVRATEHLWIWLNGIINQKQIINYV